MTRRLTPEPSLTEATAERPVRAFRGGASEEVRDRVAVEEPLGIDVGDETVSITMRTPGHDAELAAGFLFTEGVLRGAADVAAVGHVGPHHVRVTLAPGVEPLGERLRRNFYTTSSCGVCGKASLEALRVRGVSVASDRARVATHVLYMLPERARAAQAAFDTTGGLHAAALFDAGGGLLRAREDVGRHNAVDKVVGAELLAGHVPLRGHVLFVSGRAAFELVQKAAVAGVPVLAAVGAPTSLAVALAEETGMTLVGFLRDDRFNVYAGPQRIA